MRLRSLLILLAACLPGLAAAEARLLMLGDSITAGYGLAAEDSLPAALERQLRADGLEVTVLNGGVSGDTAVGGRARLDWALADRPTHAIVALGGNDALRGLDPGQTEAALAAILERLAAEGVPVLLAGMKAPRNLGAEYVAAFDSLYPRLAGRFSVMFYPFLLEGVAADPLLNQADGIHPNREGALRIAARLKAAVGRLLALPSGKTGSG